MFKQLKEIISRKSHLVIQTHDNPDHDAIATAYALQQLLIKFSLHATICYGGTIQSTALIGAIHKLRIVLYHIRNTTITHDTQIICVDGCRENNNVAHSKGRSIAIIDHHAGSLPFQLKYDFSDIRAEYGACSSILSEYYQEADLPPMPNVATSLMMGIMMDTAHLTRGVYTSELSAIQFLHPKADWHQGAKLLRNSLTLSDISIFEEAFNNSTVRGNFCFVLLQSEAASDSIGLLVDFFFNIREIDFVALINPQGDHYKISVRSDSDMLPAHEILQAAIHGIGNGGGHAHMAGGLIQKSAHVRIDGLRDKFVRLIHGNNDT